MADLIAEVRKIPPVTRFLLGSSLGVTLAARLNIIPPYYLIFLKEHVTKQLELWRLYTSMFFGSMQFDYIFELAMLYRNSNGVETMYYQGRSSDYAWQLVFACLAIILANRPLESWSHNRPLLHTLTYLSCALAPPGTQSSIMGLITLPVAYVPYAMLGMDLLVSGMNVAAQSVSGLVVGHLWWWLVWGANTGAGGMERGPLANYARAPRWLRNWFGEREGVRGSSGAGYHVVPPRRQQTSARGTGHNWGGGQRLGSS
ncbi:Der1-like family-domain-containing protein [Pisolithus orientalis]|uniref:Der1-like family-domain-containing protein n=1 Tax=Pisolithus orientalis TaxID=936130 RepID=UPI002225A3A0|nr:Der1-like family-domain-containing protein [Pisolithus orientalis]KAI6001566.1 Der1-like family-domain-containing protein [Pisolithus orientalis]